MLASYSGDTVKARELMERVLTMWRELDDVIEVGHTLATLGMAQFMNGEDEAAYRTCTELLDIATTSGDPVYVNQAKSMLGQMAVALSRIDEARRLAREVIEFSSKAGDKRAEHSGYHYLADCALIEGDCRTSIGLYDTSLTLAEAVEDRIETSFEIEGIAMSLAGMGDHETAVRLSSAARAELVRNGVTIQIRVWDALVERYITPARTALGPHRAEANARSGADLAFDDAIREAHAAARRY